MLAVLSILGRITIIINFIVTVFIYFYIIIIIIFFFNECKI